MTDTNASKSLQENHQGIEMGIYSLGDYLPYDNNFSEADRIQQIIDLAKLADQLNLDYFQVGESHQPHFISQSHLVILAAIAAQTQNIGLASSATIISTADPVRIYEDAVTIDLISQGRMELVLGRSARLGSYQALGYSLEDYDALFNEKFALFMQVNSQENLSWQGQYRSPLKDYQVLPRPYHQTDIPVWRAISGSFDSARAAAKAHCPIYLSMTEQNLDYYQELLKLYRQTWLEEDKINFQSPQVALAGLLYVNKKPQEKIQETVYPHVRDFYQNAFEDTVSPQVFESFSSQAHANYFGEVNEIVDKILYHHEELGFSRFVAQVDFGGLDPKESTRILEIYAMQIVPQVKKYTQK